MFYARSFMNGNDTVKSQKNPKENFFKPFLIDDYYPYNFPLKDIKIGRLFDTNFNKETFKNYAIFYVISGQGNILIDNKNKAFSANDTIFICNDSQYSFLDVSGQIDLIVLSFSAEYVHHILVSYSINSGVFSIDAADSFQQLYKLTQIDRGKHAGLIIANTIHSLLMLMSSVFISSPQSLSHTIRLELDSHVYDNFSINDLTESLHISKSTLMRTFKQAYGVSPHEYLLTKRIQIAKSLLSTSNLALKNIAYLLCFSDERYFSFAFTKKTGMSPTQYRSKSKLRKTPFNVDETINGFTPPPQKFIRSKN